MGHRDLVEYAGVAQLAAGLVDGPVLPGWWGLWGSRFSFVLRWWRGSGWREVFLQFHEFFEATADLLHTKIYSCKMYIKNNIYVKLS